MDDLLHNLTAAQREAVEHVDGALLILAGPGSGKTRVVTHRIAYLLQQGVAPHQILALTFTNKAAEEMQQRVAALAPGQGVWMGTFHRFCSRLLRRYAPQVGLEPNFTIFDKSDSKRALRRVVDQLGQSGLPLRVETIGQRISWAKNHLLDPEGFAVGGPGPFQEVVAAVYAHYQADLLAANAVDFDDLLVHVAHLLRENPELRRTLDERFRYVMVDEYQDTNRAQYAIVRGLSIDHPNLAVTGDPDQSIYGWRGATLSNILEFERDYPRVRIVRLEQNYRSTQRILEVAAALIEYNTRRKVKLLFTENEGGPPVRLMSYADHELEAAAVAAAIAGQVRAGQRRPGDFAVFYRVNALSRPLEDALRKEGVPYQIVQGVEFYQRAEIKDVLGYLGLLNNPRNDVAFERIINVPPRGIGRTTIARLREHGRHHRLSLLEAARQSGLIESLPKRGAVAVARFVSLYDRLATRVHGSIEELVGHVLSESGYRDQLRESELPEDHDRLQNIDELLGVARRFDELENQPTLETFLEQTALVNDTDDFASSSDRTTLMTLHASKGLEFPVVFIVGLEEGFIPHELSADHHEQLEEERRLLFVGMTRAQQELWLTRARQRDFRGRRGTAVPSSFLLELPRSQMHMEDVGRPAAPEPTGQVAQFPAYATAGGMPDESAGRTVDGLALEAGAAPAPRSRQRPQKQSGAKLMTAAEMAGEATPTAAVETIYLGVVVRHPEYGLGRVVALSGAGRRRKATVQFFAHPERQHRFVVADSPLRAVRGR